MRLPHKHVLQPNACSTLAILAILTPESRLENAGKWEGDVRDVESRKLSSATREVEVLETSKNQFEEMRLDNVT